MKILKVLGIILLVLLLLLLAGVVAVQSPGVQEKLGKRAVKILEGKTDAEISFSELSVRFPEAIVLKDVVIIDKAPQIAGADTIATVGLLTAKFSAKGLTDGNGAYISHAALKDASFVLAFEKDPNSKTDTNPSFMRVLHMTDQESNKKGWGNILSAGTLDIENFRFRMLNPYAVNEKESSYENYPGVIDWNNFNATINKLKVRHLKIKDSYVHGTVDALSIHEKDTDLDLLASGKVRVGKERVRVENFHVTDGDSDIFMERFQLDGPIKKYGDFLDDIRVSAKIREGSVISMATVSHFGPAIDKMTFRADVSGKVNGYVRDFDLDNLSFKEHGSGVSGTVSGNIMYVVNIQNSLFDLSVKSLSFTMDGISKFVRSVAPETQLNLKKIAKGERFTFKGTAKGPLNRLGVNGKISSRIGGVNAGLTIRNTVDVNRPIKIGGDIKTTDLDLGKILDTESLGPLSVETSLQATLGKKETVLDTIALKISRLNALNYDYTGISANGNYRESAFNGKIVSNDPNLDFLFEGLFNLSPKTKNAQYQFYALLANADLHALHLDSRPVSRMRFFSNADFLKTSDGDILGDINVSGLSLDSDTGRHEVGNIKISSHSNGTDMSRIQFVSNFLKGSFVGEKNILAFINDIRNLTIDKELPALTKEHATPWDKSTYSLNIQVQKAQEVIRFFAPGVYIADGSELSVNVNKDGTVTGGLRSDLLAWSGKYLRDVNLSLDNAAGKLLTRLESSAMFISGAELLNNTLTVSANDNHIGLGYSFDNDTDNETRAEVYLTGDISRDRNGLGIVAKALPSNIYYNGEGWGLNSGDIVIKAGDINVDRLVARHDEEALFVHGGFSKSKKDTLTVNMEKFSLSLLDSFTGASPALEGKATGSALILSPFSPAPGLLASIVCDNTTIDGHKAGTVNLESHWNTSTQAFDFSLSNRLEAISNISVAGFIKPSTKEINATAKLLRLDLGYASFVLDSVFSSLEGAISGEVGIGGKYDDIQLSSRGLHLDDGILEVDFTRVPYYVNGSLSLDDFGLHFDDVSIADNTGGTGTVSGSVLWGGFKNIGLDTHVNFDHMHAVSLDRGTNSTLYGDVYASGRVDIMGPLHALNLDVDAETAGAGNVHIPISSSGSSRSTQLLTFVEPPKEADPDYMEIINGSVKESAKRSSNLNVHLKMTATPDVALFIELGDDNSLNGSGSGTIELESIPAQSLLTLNGDYTFTQGNFHFSAMGLVSRDFAILDGSTVRLNGDIWDTDLNVDGMYTTKTSLASLISDETATTRRTVECHLNLSEKLSNPLLSFKIEVPDLNPATKAMVESALNTEDKMQKQFLALLVTGNFLPEDDTGITTTGTSTLFSNVTGIMASQINTIFQKLDIPVDVGLNYRTNETGNDLFDVALSTQLFNNRVIVNGNIGNKQQYGMSTNEVAGDVDVEIKVNNSGSLRLNLFSHSADQFTSYLDNSQRSGAGVTYQREFDTFRGLAHDVFTPKEKLRQEAIQALLNPTGSIVLQVDTTGKTKLKR